MAKKGKNPADPVREKAKAAVRHIQEAMADTHCDELTALRIFDEEFDALREGWRMRISELEDEERDYGRTDED